MESLGIQARPAPFLQPAHALQGDVAAVLREGRVLAGEVLQQLDGGSLLIGVGGKFRVPANSRADLQPGDRFLFQVVRADVGAAASDLVLRVLEGETKESLLLRTLQSRTPGEAVDLGQALRDLGQALRASGPRGEALLAALRGGAFSAQGVSQGPSSEAASALRSALSFGGVRHEATLLNASLAQAPAETVLGEFTTLLLERALGGELDSRSAAGRVVVQPAAADLRAALSTAKLENAELSSILRAVANQVRTRPVPGAAAASLRSQLARGLEKIAGGATAALTETLRRLVHGSTSTATRELGEAQTNRKALLLQALMQPEADGEGELTSGAREATGRALRAIESEQLQSVLRREVGAAQRFSLPFLTGQEMSSAKIWVEREKPDQKASDSVPESDRRTRATVALELSTLGPVRVDVLLHGDRIALRALVSHEEAALSLRAGFEGLRKRFEANGQELLGGGVSVERDPARLRAEDLEGGQGALTATRASSHGSNVLNTLG